MKPKNGGSKIDLMEIRNVRRDEELIVEKVTDANYSVSSLTRTGHTVYTCEIHFPLPSEDIKEVDLIEGRGMENTNNFNCFSMKLRKSEDKELGSHDDRQKKIYEFEKKFGIERNKPKPEPEPQPEPEPTPPNTTTDTPSDNSLPSNVKVMKTAEDLKCGELLVLGDLHFKDNSIDYKGMVAAKRTLHIILVYMHDNPEVNITLYGHTDIYGDPEKNKQLSKLRVHKIFSWLCSMGIKSRRIDHQWFGSSRPLIKEGSPAMKARGKKLLLTLERIKDESKD